MKPASLTLTMSCIAALWFGVSWMSGCARTPPEQQLRETIARLQTGIETRDAAALEEALAEDFIGPEGLDRDGARRMARRMFVRHRDVAASLGPLQVDLEGTHATVRFTAAVTGGAGGVLPESGQVYDVETGWRREGDDWRLVNAHWKPRL